MSNSFDQPLDKRSRKIARTHWDSEATGVIAERIARFTGTPRFLIYLSIFVVLWIGWNSLAPDNLRFDSSEIGFTALTLMLSLQASYSAPLILLAQNRQDDRDRVTAQNDRQVAQRNLADTEYITREIASLRLALGEVATRDFVRSELRDLIEDLARGEDSKALHLALAERDKKIAHLEQRLAELDEQHASQGEPHRA
ncbi:MAG: DUF1003 domain-containing protein [Actinomycetaceae bacterium]|nr:DUF1003 domain-containing protein [Arcanobacterium sp.]MDD7686884.1 DUF1003 domain-containing protein [Actinomycetaceae bacterium]MDY5274025.1 DUF1003 domain-containing protein [Arcanobacterium sp.]